MSYLLGFLLFIVGFFIGGFCWLFIYVWYSFKRYFKFPLFDNKD